MHSMAFKLLVLFALIFVNTIDSASAINIKKSIFINQKTKTGLAILPQRAPRVHVATHRIRFKIVKCCGKKRCNDFNRLKHKNFSVEHISETSSKPLLLKVSQTATMSTLVAETSAEEETTETPPGDTILPEIKEETTTEALTSAVATATKTSSETKPTSTVSVTELTSKTTRTSSTSTKITSTSTTTKATSTTTTTTTTTRPAVVNTICGPNYVRGRNYYNLENYLQCQNLTCQSYNDISAKPPAGATVTAEIVTCGRTYTIIKPAMSNAAAAASCAARNLTLVTMQTLEEKNCLQSVSQKLTVEGTDFWTSGSSEGSNCSYKGALWCASADDLAVSASMLEVKTPGHCVELRSTGNLVEADCSTNMAAMCEPLCEKAQCPATSAINTTLLYADGRIKEPQLYGTWFTLGKGLYLFGNKIATWETNMQICSSLGMIPFTFESQEEFDAVNALTKKNWTLNLNYWTAGTRQRCRGQWTNCPSGSVVQDAFWKQGQPMSTNSALDCAHLQISKNGTGMGLTSRNCSHKYVYACKKQLLLENYDQPACPDPLTCKKDLTLFDINKRFISMSIIYFKNPLQIISIDQSQYGAWFTKCGRHYLFSSTKATWAAARDKCCSLGFTLLEIEKLTKNICIQRLIDRYLPPNVMQAGEFWTSGTDKNSTGRFRWCSSGAMVIKDVVRWKPGHPTTGCVYLDNSVKMDNVTVLATAECTQEKYFICERLQQADGGIGLQYECMSTWNINSTDLAMVETGLLDMSTVPRRVKCFVKCLGESIGMFLNGALVTESILRSLEEDIEEPEQLQSSFADAEECSGKTAGDECVTAAEIYKCGLDKNQTLVNQLIAQRNFVTDSDPAGCLVERTCTSVAQPCKKNVTHYDTAIAAGTSFVDGYFFTLASKPKLFLGYPVMGMRHEEAFQYCCSLGLTIFTKNKAAFPGIEYTDIANYMTANNIPDYKFYVSESYTQPNGVSDDTYCGSKSKASLSAASFQEYKTLDGTAARLCQTSVVIMQFISAKLIPIPRDRTPSDEPIGFLCE